MKARLLIVGLVLGAGSSATFACSSSSSTSPNEAPSTGCPTGSSSTGTPSACRQCEDAMCGAQTSALQSACGPCIAKCECGDTSCSAACTMQEACAAAESNLVSQCDKGVCATACSGGPGTSIACNLANSCAIFLPGAEMACITAGGTVLASCPTDNLLGCCTLTGGEGESCYYLSDGGASEADLQAACATQGGHWSATL